MPGVLSLSRLIVLYDDNGISIDGEVKDWFGDNTPLRFESYGWNVIAGIDGHDAWAVDQALAQAQGLGDGRRGWMPTGTRRFAPTFIACKTVIGKGAPHRAGTSKAHGEALGADEVAATRKALNWTSPPFEIPCDVYASWDATATGAQQQSMWEDLFKAYAERYPVEAGEFERRMRGVLPADWESIVARMVDDAVAKAESMATPRRFAAGAESPRARRCRNCSAARPTSPAATSPTGRACSRFAWCRPARPRLPARRRRLPPRARSRARTAARSRPAATSTTASANSACAP